MQPATLLAPLYIGSPSRTAVASNSALAKRVRALSTVTWLPVYRSNVLASGGTAASLSPVDQRLEDIEKVFSEYVTEILSKSKIQNEEFQKRFFFHFWRIAI